MKNSMIVRVISNEEEVKMTLGEFREKFNTNEFTFESVWKAAESDRVTIRVKDKFPEFKVPMWVYKDGRSGIMRKKDGKANYFIIFNSALKCEELNEVFPENFIE